MNAEKMARLEDNQNGRVIPAWRFWAGYVVVGLAWLISGLPFIHNIGWRMLIELGLLAAYYFLFVGYRRRTLR